MPPKARLQIHFFTFHFTVVTETIYIPELFELGLSLVFCVVCGSILSILFSWAEWAVRRSRRQFRAAFCDYHVPKIKAKDKIFCPVFLTIQQLFSSKICPNNPFPFKSPLFQSDFSRCYLWTAPTWHRYIPSDFYLE